VATAVGVKTSAGVNPATYSVQFRSTQALPPVRDLFPWFFFCLSQHQNEKARRPILAIIRLLSSKSLPVLVVELTWAQTGIVVPGPHSLTHQLVPPSSARSISAHILQLSLPILHSICHIITTLPTERQPERQPSILYEYLTLVEQAIRPHPPKQQHSLALSTFASCVCVHAGTNIIEVIAYPLTDRRRPSLSQPISIASCAPLGHSHVRFSRPCCASIGHDDNPSAQSPRSNRQAVFSNIPLAYPCRLF